MAGWASWDATIRVRFRVQSSRWTGVDGSHRSGACKGSRSAHTWSPPQAYNSTRRIRSVTPTAEVRLLSGCVRWVERTVRDARTFAKIFAVCRERSCHSRVAKAAAITPPSNMLRGCRLAKVVAKWAVEAVAWCSHAGTGGFGGGFIAGALSIVAAEQLLMRNVVSGA